MIHPAETRRRWKTQKYGYHHFKDTIIEIKLQKRKQQRRIKIDCDLDAVKFRSLTADHKEFFNAEKILEAINNMEDDICEEKDFEKHVENEFEKALDQKGITLKNKWF